MVCLRFEVSFQVQACFVIKSLEVIYLALIACIAQLSMKYDLIFLGLWRFAGRFHEIYRLNRVEQCSEDGFGYGLTFGD